MAVVHTFRCDALNCTVVKGESNHWFRIKTITGGPFHVFTWEMTEDADNVLTGIQELHACSESCVVKLMSKFLRGA